MYSIYEDLPRCSSCGASVEPWTDQPQEEGVGLCSHCQDERAHEDEEAPATLER